MRRVHPVEAIAVTGLCASACAFATRAGAQDRPEDKAMCAQAASQGQNDRDAHRLLEARASFRACAQKQCPGVVQRDCEAWLADVERDLPTVVVSVRDAAGSSLPDVRVNVDGQPAATKLDGTALPMNPGPHALRFELSDGTKLDKDIVVVEGLKNQVISAEVSAPAAPPAETVSRRSTPWKTVGYALGGVGLVGIGIGTVFGVQAIVRKGDDCNSGVCAPGSIDDIRSSATWANVSLGAGGALLATGALLAFLPHLGTPKAVAAEIVPVVGRNSGGLELAGRW